MADKEKPVKTVKIVTDTPRTSEVNEESLIASAQPTTGTPNDSVQRPTDTIVIDRNQIIQIPTRATATPIGSPVTSPIASPLVLSPAPSITRQQFQPPPSQQPRHHRLSGLFSKDDLSIDISLSPSERIRPASNEPAVGGTSTKVPIEGQGDVSAVDKNRRRSIAAGSLGSASTSDGDIFPIDLERYRRERYKPFRRRWRRFKRKFKGCIFAFMSSFASSLASYFVHHLTTSKEDTGNEPYSPSLCLLWRYSGVLFPGIFIVLYYRFWCKDMVFDTIWPLHEKENIKRFCLSILRGTLDVFAVLLNYISFKYLLQSETSTILNSKPIVVQLLAHFTLGEEWGIVPIIVSLIAAVGVLIMSKPPFILPESMRDEKDEISDRDFTTERLPGIWIAIGSMLLSSVVYCVLRYLKDVHYSVFALFIGTAGMVLGLGMTFGRGEFKMPTETTEYLEFLAVAFLTCISSIFIVIALQNEEAFVVSLVRSLDVIFSILYEMWLNQNYPDWYRGGGAFIVMFCVVLIFFRKYLTHQDPNSKCYRVFQLLTK